MSRTLQPNDAASVGWQEYTVPLMLTLVAFLLYLFTLAPTVLWGDDAFFQRTAYEGLLQADGGGHWLWFQFARLFILLPFGDIAYRVNLLSAVAAALTIFVMYYAARALDLSQTAAIVAASSLAVAHTFWMHAVRAEVYTLFTLWMTVEIWLWAKWDSTMLWPIHLAAFLFGIGLLSHQLAIILLPAFGLLFWLRRSLLSTRLFIQLLIYFVLGMVLFLIAIQNQIRAPNLVESLLRYFTHSDRDFTSSFFDFSLALLPHDLAMWLGMLGLQFVGVAGILGLWAVIYAIRHRTHLSRIWLVIATVYVSSIFFALSYRVNDQYVFYLPSYVAFAFIVGLGWEVAIRRGKRLSKPALQTLAMLLIITIPPLVYCSTGMAFAALDVNPLRIRSLPGREPNTFFLWPGKAGYYGAADYGRQVFEVLPSDSFLIADHTPYETILYYQRVEHVRPDVHIIKVEAEQDLEPILKSIPRAARIFVADNDPRYYNFSHIPNPKLDQAGVIYEIVAFGSY
jgi:hypothetical protein